MVKSRDLNRVVPIDRRWARHNRDIGEYWIRSDHVRALLLAEAVRSAGFGGNGHVRGIESLRIFGFVVREGPNGPAFLSEQDEI